MHASNYHIHTQKEAPAEADIVSHQLMTRAGMIRRLAGGIYTYMPLGLKVLRKIEHIVREEMNRAGAIELLMPFVQPAELWQETGRWQEFGPELLRIQDRHRRDFILQPTSEEVVTDIARAEIQSWRQLPVNFYHIQTKFRDERRPRFGLMRGREFLMKDAYSFDKDEAAAQQSYEKMFAAYVRIFERMGLRFRAVAADTGAIGGSLSHEFQVIADTGEDLIVYHPEGDYAANIELAEAPCLIEKRQDPTLSLEKIATPQATKCELVAEQLGAELSQTVKAVVLATDNERGNTQIWLLLVRGDHEVNEVKVSKIPGFEDGYRAATEEEIRTHFKCEPGYLGPVDLDEQVKVIADLTVANMSDFICGANESGYHYAGVNWGRDVAEPLALDIRNVVEGDPAPGGGKLALQRGIEVGHVFFLGDTYAKKMRATYLDQDGKPAFMQMGCYGIGISRIAAAAIEQNHDDKGMIWPRAIAPFEVVLCALGANKNPEVQQAAEQIYHDLKALGVDVILDDRDIRPGVMFADWELIGVPVRITIGQRGLKNDTIEIQTRYNGEDHHSSLSQCAQRALELLDSL